MFHFNQPDTCRSSPWPLLLLLLALASITPAALEAQDGRPQVHLAANDRITEVGRKITITWSVARADSVSVRREGSQISTDHQGAWEETTVSKGVIQWEVTATNRSGTSSEELEIKVVSIGSVASLITGGPGGEWVTQLVLSIVPGIVIIVAAVLKGAITPAPFIAAGISMPSVAFVAGAFGVGNYWLATSLALLIVVAIVAWVALEKG